MCFSIWHVRNVIWKCNDTRDPLRFAVYSFFVGPPRATPPISKRRFCVCDSHLEYSACSLPGINARRKNFIRLCQLVFCGMGYDTALQCIVTCISTANSIPITRTGFRCANDETRFIGFRHFLDMYSCNLVYFINSISTRFDGTIARAKNHARTNRSTEVRHKVLLIN
jgi:hypothetical protein